MFICTNPQTPLLVRDCTITTAHVSTKATQPPRRDTREVQIAPPGAAPCDLSPLCLSASGLPEGSEPTYLQTGGSQQQSVRGRALAALNQWDVGNVINDPVFWVGSSGGTFCVLLRSFSRMDPPTTVSNNYMSVSSFLTCPSQISPPTLWDRFCNKSLHPKLCLRPCSQGHSN